MSKDDDYDYLFKVVETNKFVYRVHKNMFLQMEKQAISIYFYPKLLMR